MIPPRPKVILLTLLVVAFAMLPWSPAQQQRQRRVFTNEDVVRTPPPAPVPVETQATPAEGTPAATSTPAVPDAATSEGADLPQGLALAQHLQEVLRRYHPEIGVKLEQEVDAGRQNRWSTMMDLTTQLIVQNQMYINDLQAQQAAAAEAEAQAQAGAP